MSDSSSDRGDGDDWDDMAIVRAFEDALADKRSGSTGARANGAKRPATDKHGDRRGREPSAGAPQDSASYGGTSSSHAPTAAPRPYRTPSTTAHQVSSGGYSATQPPTAPYQQPHPSFQHQQQFDPQQNQAAPASTADTYRGAYAQAYAAIMAQMQAAAASNSAFSPIPPPGPTYGAPPVPPHPNFQPPSGAFGHSYGPSIPTPPFAGAAGFSPTSQTPHGLSGGGDDGLANLLLAWYQSGYYTGRFQAMQEMKSRR